MEEKAEICNAEREKEVKNLYQEGCREMSCFELSKIV